MTHFLTSLHFLHPAWLLALPPLLLLTVWLARSIANEGNWSKIVDAQLLPLLRISEGRRARSTWPLLVGSIWTLAVLALAGPAWNQIRSPAFRAPASWLLVLDLSPSMGASDLSPSRVARARYAAADILSAAHDARVGLVAFAGEPHTVAPLTSDVATVRVLLQPLTPGLMPESGDRLAPALHEAQQLLSAGGYTRHGQVVVLSDGVSDPVESLRVAQELRKGGATINVIGVGTATGAPEPNGKGDFVHDPTGRPHITRLQTEELQHIAAAGGGAYVSANGVSGLIKALEAQQARALDADKASSSSETMLSSWQNEGVWLLPPLLLLAAGLARRGWV
ncbi:MAG TPA: VWA domain-containing protein [Steroidobacteraceae bacterium]